MRLMRFCSRFKKTLPVVFSAVALVLAPCSASTEYRTAAAPAQDETRLLESVLHRLAGDDLHSYLGFNPVIILTADSFPNAFIDRQSRILISQSLLRQTQEFSEIAFVIAHELAHILISREVQESTGKHPDSCADNFGQEIYVDSRALELLGAAGLDLRGGREILSRMIRFGSQNNLQLDKTFPSLKARLMAIDEKLG